MNFKSAAIGAMALLAPGLTIVATPASAALNTFGTFADWSAATSGLTTVALPEPSPDSTEYVGYGDLSYFIDSLEFSISEPVGLANLYLICPAFRETPPLRSQRMT
jgi:hypothetical protein